MSRKLFLSTVLCHCVFLVGCVVNPITGKEEFMVFPEEQDIAIGKKYAPEVEKQLGGRIESAGIQNYVQSVGQRIAKVSHRPDIEYHFLAVNDKSVNALALPGGYIFITKGMLNNLRNEAQLAAIMAHEISHVVARDSMNIMSNEIGLGILASAVISEDAPGGLMTATDLTRQILSLRYSRSDERTADLGGLDYMYKAGYDPYAMVQTMQMLTDQQQVRPIEFLSTHPNPQNRAEDINEKIRNDYFNLTGLETGQQDYKRIILDQL